MGQLKSKGKSFEIWKGEVWEAYLKVKENRGAPGVDGQSLDEFEVDLKGNLYRIWNRMSSGTWFPPPVRAVEIPKPLGAGTRTLGIPTIADRIAQTVAARRLEEAVEPIFHPDSYGYRPRRSALDAVAVCRRRCWKSDWVIDLDIAKFLDVCSYCFLPDFHGWNRACWGVGGSMRIPFRRPVRRCTARRSPRAIRSMIALRDSPCARVAFKHREPPLGGFVDEQRPDLVGETDPPRRAGGELRAVDGALGGRAGQGRGWEVELRGGVG